MKMVLSQNYNNPNGYGNAFIIETTHTIKAGVSYLFDVIFWNSLRSDIHCILLHVFWHVRIFYNCLSLIHRSFRKHCITSIFSLFFSLKVSRLYILACVEKQLWRSCCGFGGARVVLSVSLLKSHVCELLARKKDKEKYRRAFWDWISYLSLLAVKTFSTSTIISELATILFLPKKQIDFATNFRRVAAEPR